MTLRPLRILFAAAEAYPFAKVGGLADVAASLPKALTGLGHDVVTVVPGYPSVPRARLEFKLEIPIAERVEVATVYSYAICGGQMFTVSNDAYFGRDRIYGYEDDDERFIFFSKAVVGIAARTGFEPDILHGHDWHLGLAPQYARQGPHRDALAGMGIVFTMHNVAYQGPYSETAEDLIGLQQAFDGNLPSRGISFADKITTVSPCYAKEILTSEHGHGLEERLRSRTADLHGILNGIDSDEFNPETDGNISVPYSALDVSQKAPNKRALQERAGLTLDSRSPLLAMVARLVDQKGYAILLRALDRIVDLGAQVVVNGIGEERYAQALAEAVERHPGHVAHLATDDETTARQVYAGADLLLAPSNFEPCGLTPLIALRYGTIPIVRRTGGLADTIVDYLEDPAAGIGFTFMRKYAGQLVRAINNGIVLYRNVDEWRRLQRRAMSADFSWKTSALEYGRLYRSAITAASGAGRDRIPEGDLQPSRGG